MSRYIDKDALFEKMQDWSDAIERDYDGDSEEYAMGFREAMEYLENAPTADVQEVRHAEWVHYGEYVQCCNCEHVTDDIYYEGDMDSGYYTVLPRYCSNCGCKMEE